MSLAGGAARRRDTRAIPTLDLLFIDRKEQCKRFEMCMGCGKASLGEMLPEPLIPLSSHFNRVLASITYLNFIITVMNWYIFCFAL